MQVEALSVEVTQAGDFERGKVLDVHTPRRRNGVSTDNHICSGYDEIRRRLTLG